MLPARPRGRSAAPATIAGAVISSVVVTTDECRTGGAAVAGRAAGRFTLATGRTDGGGGVVTTGG
ncbi:hypothetical protein, partial [Streptomyces sp. SID3343]|uniref:hypothetical protein n=1 Tax=Streptomyces sp. SID3343 TaxID=2690260 RepID=UPI001F276EC0